MRVSAAAVVRCCVGAGEDEGVEWQVRARCQGHREEWRDRSWEVVELVRVLQEFIHTRVTTLPFCRFAVGFGDTCEVDLQTSHARLECVEVNVALRWATSARQCVSLLDFFFLLCVSERRISRKVAVPRRGGRETRQ